jgi:hypothetical protein
MESIAPSAGAEQVPADAPDAAAEERLERNLTPAIAEAGESAGYLRYALGTVVTMFVVLGAIFAFNVIVDPFSLAGTRLLPTALENDRTAKLDLIDKLKHNPQIVVLGSSRSRQADPKWIQELTGKTGFNAGVTGGDSADAWVMVRNIAARFPHAKRTYIWFVEQTIATNGINPQLAQDRRSSGYLGQAGPRFSLADVGTYLGFAATKASWRVAKACIEGHCHGRIRYQPDGALTPASQKFLPEKAASLPKSVKPHLKAAERAPTHVTPFDPRSPRYSYFEKALAYMNAHGATPVIVLNPIYPSIYTALQKRGFAKRNAGLALLRKLHTHFHFVVVDCTDIRVWHGKKKWFNNATHVNGPNMKLMLRYIVAHSQGAFR